MKKTWALFSSAVIYALLSGCAHIPAIPPPGRPVTDKVLPPVEASVINLPVTVQLAPAAAQADKAVPRGEDHDRGDNDWIIVSNIQGDVGYRYYWERTPITLNVNNGAINVSTEIRYRQRGGLRSFAGWKSVCCGCGADWPRAMKLGLRTTLTLTDDWQVEPHTVAVPMQAAVGCALTELGFATNRITGVARNLLKNTAASVDDYLRAELNPRVAKIQRAWRAIQDPIPMPGGESLLLHPEALRISTLNGGGDKLTFSIGLLTRPRIVKGSVPAIKARPLPATPEAPPGGEDFHVALVEEIPFDIAAGALSGAFKDRSYVIGNKKVYIEKVRLYGSGSSAVIEAELRADGPWGPHLRTKVYLTGEPEYDGAARAIFIGRLDYTPETKSVLAKAAGWLLDERLRKDLAGNARWYIGNRLDGQRSELERALNRDLNPHVRLNFSPLAVRTLSVGVTSSALKAVFVSDGTAGLTVR